MIRTHQTTQDIIGEKFQLPQLNEINGGDFDGLAYEEIAEMNPIEFAKRDQDKLRYRYPNGESYVDVCRYEQQGSFVNDVTQNFAFSDPLSVTLLFHRAFCTWVT